MSTEPKLAPPGAGLPFLQRIAVRLLVGPLISRMVPLEKTKKQYENLINRIIEQVERVPLEQRSKRILVKPLPGLEDSSRYWSINGVLEHLLIVNRRMEQVILDLTAGKKPEGKANTANVKPSHFEHDYLSEFKSHCPTLIKRIDDEILKRGTSIHSGTTFEHPWFGPMTARQWRWTLASHQGVHYTQIKEIMRQLD
jgi:hypothetical protein